MHFNKILKITTSKYDKINECPPHEIEEGVKNHIV